jgi:hypothetical protein
VRRRRPGVAGGLAGVVALAACGSKPPAADTGPTVSARPLTRVQVEEPEADDGVVIAGGKGHVEPEVAVAAIAPHRDQLTACYLQRVGRRRWLGGHLVLRWEVAADGTVDRVLLADNDLGAWPVEKCVLELARDIQFGAPIGGPAEVTLPLAFSAKGSVGLWDDDQSAKAVGPQLAKLDACARGQPVTPKDVAITIYVGPRGKPLSVGFGSTASAIADAWATCAEKAVLAWHLPDPKGQVTKLAVRYRTR